MEIISLDNYYEKRFSTAIALGNFDGIHIGHQNLIKSMIRIAKDKGLKPGILLFENHTKNIVLGNGPQLLSSRQQKLDMFEELGVEVIYSTEFNKKTRSLSPEEFVRDILISKLNTALITVGFDYKFGYKASGDVVALRSLGKKYNFDVNVVQAQYSGNLIVSSSKIRKLLKNGVVKDARTMLGRNYSIRGRIVHGKSLGRKLGYPTANINLSDEFIIPKSGVYVTNTLVGGKKFKSVTSVGKNPTFDEKKLKIECHILNFNKSIYGEIIEIEFIDYIRDEIKFGNLDDLKKQIEKDIEFAKFRDNHLQ